MRAVIQRVTRASVAVNGGEPRPIGPGLVILLGVRDTDDIAIVPKLAEKCAHLRIFEDEDGKLNRSAVELGYSALVVSNFTLYGDTSRGKRPSFSHAAKVSVQPVRLCSMAFCMVKVLSVSASTSTDRASCRAR